MKYARERQLPYDFTYTGNLNETNEQAEPNREAHGHRERTDDCQREEGSGSGVEGTTRHRFPVVK